MAMVSGGILAARMLKAEGVDYIFSLVGGHIYALYDACRDAGIKIVDVRHEEAAAHMAEGFSLVTGKPGVCVVTAGPGFTNMITGVAAAAVANSPIICLAGHSGIREYDTGALQDLNQIDIIKPLTKLSRTVYQTERIPEYMAMAFRHCLAGRPGPVYLEIPLDVFYNQVDESGVEMPERYRTQTRPAGDPAEIEKALALLQQAKRPLVVAGSGVWWSQAHKELQAFVEKSGIPAFTRNNGRGAISDKHPLCFGVSALAGLFKADVALIIGTQLNNTLAYGKFPPELKVIQVDIEPSVIGHNRAIDVGIIGDAKNVLRQLTDGIEQRSYDVWVETLRQAKAKRAERNRPFMESDKIPIHPLRLCRELTNFIDEDTIVCIDGGDISVFGSMVLPACTPAQHLANGASSFGCLGVGLPYGLAAKLARPEKKVLVLCGDGSFGFNAMEFDTALRHNLPIVCVIGNDGCWGMMRHGAEAVVGADRIVGCDLPLRKYHKVVEALGGHGELVERPSDIRPAIERAFASGKPACVNVLTDIKVSPQKPAGDAEFGA
ncbi:MAG: thiamine pyrophosphate-binding protein [Candidatus Abyssobacteria bacterium SURF_5]|uniref:Thiamine pyrophosphate-binding protein n=1 Tax=Abyssobacteria bacterium (strain SURF_5) TaxID=2093360 RepID=A0A3A4NHC5_ABYX5|nr:MAG: thiamine pyrophosphate-binding protein [Candidatus Abyssubacteria bacterium SURF_5]